MNASSVFSVAVLALLCCANVEALQCYQCAGVPQCTGKIGTRNCPSDDYQCVTEKILPGVSYLFPDGIETKDCLIVDSSLRDSCDSDNKVKGAWCNVCSTDLCNSAEVYTLSFVLMSVVFLILNRVV